jgi:23S rRNA (adenine2503-C2)-methyltransferase
LPGLNDARADVRAIVDFCEPLGRVLVNVIPYNPGSMPIARAPSEQEVEQFIGWIREEGLPVRQRAIKGRSVMAACGQLGNPSARADRRPLL